jgi:RNA polymerase sigma factor (sigma-70 family)
MVSSSSLVRPYAKATGDALLSLCADRGNIQAWDEFLLRFDALVTNTARRVARRYTRPYPELCDDLAQQVYLKLNDHEARVLRQFVPTHEGACFGFLKVVTANVVHDYFRSKTQDLPENLPEDLPDARQHQDPVLFREIDDFLRREVRALDRQIFWLHYRQGMTAGEIAAVPGVNLTIKGVESLLKRMRDLVCKEFSGSQKKAASAAAPEGGTEIL